MPKYTGNWYEDQIPFDENEDKGGLQVLLRKPESVTPVIFSLDPVELLESRERVKTGWEQFQREQERVREEVEETILMAFAPAEADYEELIALRDWMKIGVVKYGYVDEGELSDEQIAMMMEAVYKFCSF